MNHWMDLKEILQESLMVHGTIDGFLKIFMGVPLNQSVDVWHFFCVQKSYGSADSTQTKAIESICRQGLCSFWSPTVALNE